jgi:thioredoxin reductase (NADPH)
MFYDVLIIGGGPAGLAAGIYAARAGAKTILLDRIGPGGQVSLTERIENYPGFPRGIGGMELADLMAEQGKRFGLVIESAGVTGIAAKNGGGSFSVATREVSYDALTVILATGGVHKMLDVPGEDRFYGRGVHYCATCDGPFYKGRHVAVAGGGDSAIEEALFLLKLADKVSVIHRRDKLRATRVLQDKLLSNPKATVLWNSEVIEIIGETAVKNLRIKNRQTGETMEYPVDGLFIFTGIKPDTDFLRGLVKLDGDGYILTDDEMRTSVPGIFACGDARKKLLRQVVTACGDGAIAGFLAAQYVEHNKRA